MVYDKNDLPHKRVPQKGQIYEVNGTACKRMPPEELTSISSILASAFNRADPVMEWVFHSSPTGEKLALIFERICSGTLSEGGTLFVNPERTACCLVDDIHVGNKVAPEDCIMKKTFIDVGADNVQKDRLTRVHETLAQHRPSYAHRYIKFFGVAPISQGKGVGKRFMKDVLNLFRHEICYLETESLANVAFWSKVGFVRGDHKKIAPTLTFYFMERACS